MIDGIQTGESLETRFNQRRLRAAGGQLNLFIQRWVHYSISGLMPLCRLAVILG